MMTLKMVIECLKEFDGGCIYIRRNAKEIDRLDFLHYGFQYPEFCNINSRVHKINIGYNEDDGIVIYIDLM